MTVHVDAVVNYHIFNAVMSIKNITDANRATQLLAQTTLRNILGTVKLAELLSARDVLQNQLTVQCNSRVQCVCVCMCVRVCV